MNPTFPYGVNMCKAARSVKTVGTTQSQHPKSKLMRLTPEGGSSLASQSDLETFVFGQLFIFFFSQTVCCKMRDWKNIAVKYHRENIKVKNNNGKSSVFVGFQLLHPCLLACYKYYYFHPAITEQCPHLSKDAFPQAELG